MSAHSDDLERRAFPLPSGAVTDNPIERLIRKAFADRAQQIAEQEICEAQKRIEAALRRMVGQIAIEVGQHYKVEFHQDEIVIRVIHERELYRDGEQAGTAPQGVHRQNPPRK